MSDTTNENEQLLKFSEVAKRLCITTWSVRKMARLGLLPSVRIGFGKRGILRVRESQLRAYIAKHATKTERATSK